MSYKFYFVNCVNVVVCPVCKMHLLLEIGSYNSNEYTKMK